MNFISAAEAEAANAATRTANASVLRWLPIDLPPLEIVSRLGHRFRR